MYPKNKVLLDYGGGEGEGRKDKKKERQSRKEEEMVPGRCALFIQKRGRYCRLAVARGSRYCGEHLNFDPELGVSSTSSQRRRIPCPLDPHHTVYEHQLKQHLKKCNAAKKGTPVCYHANINTGIPNYQPTDEEKLPLSAFPQIRLDNLIARVEKVYRESGCHIEEVVLDHPAMHSDLSDPGNGATALKHIRQQASILGHLERLHLLQPHTCFVEFGAGRGKLTNCLQRACSSDETLHYLLVDRASCRRKMDVYRRGDASSEARVQRLLIDIEHLDLGEVACLRSDGVRNVVAISKHLCGAATDLTLRCLLGTLQPMALQNSDDVTLPHHQTSPAEPPKAKRTCSDPPSLTPSPPPSLTPSPPPSHPPSLTPHPSHKLRAIVIALCCHHRCGWSQLAGTAWLRGHGFSPIDVHLIAKMSSWAVCGVRAPAKHATPAASHDPHLEDDDSLHSLSDHESTTTFEMHSGPISMTTDSTQSPSIAMATMPPTTSACPDVTTATSSAHPPSYHPHPREAIGITCKRLLDVARLRYLRDKGMEGRLVYFVSRGTSLENVLLIATPTAAS